MERSVYLDINLDDVHVCELVECVALQNDHFSTEVAAESKFRFYRRRDGKRGLFVVPNEKVSPFQRSMYRLRRKLMSVQWKHFFTLTVSPENYAAFSSKDISKFINRIRRRGFKGRYAWRVELGEQKGRLHVHFLTDSFVPRVIDSWGLGYVDIERVDFTQQLLKNYVSKICNYCAKEKSEDVKELHTQFRRRYGLSVGIKSVKSEWVLAAYGGEWYVM